MRIVYMGTPTFAVSALQALIDAGHDVVGVYSQPPRPAGRGMHLQKSPVHITAQAAEIPVFTPKNFKSAPDIQEFINLKPDLAVVAAYGLILPKEILDVPTYGCLNIHASLLPRWRGAAPIQRAILAGDHESGVTIMQMDVGLDTGDMLAVGHVPITDSTTTQSLHDELAAQGAELIINVINQLPNLKATKQPEDGITYASKITKEEGLLSWNYQARDIDRKLRALNPWPGTWFEYQGKRIKVLDAQIVEHNGDEPVGTVLDILVVKCADKAIRLRTLQPEGKKPMSGEDFANGYQIKCNSRLN